MRDQATIERLERALDEARAYREAMWLEVEGTRAWGGPSHLDRVAEYARASQRCRQLAECVERAYGAV